MQNRTFEKCGIKLLKSAERGGTIVTKDMHEDEDRKRSPNKMRMLIRSLSGIVML